MFTVTNIIGTSHNAWCSYMKYSDFFFKVATFKTVHFFLTSSYRLLNVPMSQSGKWKKIDPNQVGCFVLFCPCCSHSTSSARKCNSSDSEESFYPVDHSIIRMEFDYFRRIKICIAYNVESVFWINSLVIMDGYTTNNKL